MIKGKIVYIDEDPDHIIYFCDFAGDFFDVEVIQVENGNELESVVDEILSSPHDAVISDYLLNEKATVGFDGQALIEMVQSRNKHIPCFLLTSHAPDAINATHDARIVQSKGIPFGSEDTLKAVFRTQISKLIEHYRAGYGEAVRELEELCQVASNDLTASQRQRINELDDLVESYGFSSAPIARELKEEKGVELLSKLIESVDLLLSKYGGKK